MPQGPCPLQPTSDLLAPGSQSEDLIEILRMDVHPGDTIDELNPRLWESTVNGTHMRSLIDKVSSTPPRSSAYGGDSRQQVGELLRMARPKIAPAQPRI